MSVEGFHSGYGVYGVHPSSMGQFIGCDSDFIWARLAGAKFHAYVQVLPPFHRSSI
jgi:hypothetical protein